MTRTCGDGGAPGPGVRCGAWAALLAALLAGCAALSPGPVAPVPSAGAGAAATGAAGSTPAPASPAAASAAPPAALRYAFVVLGADGRAVARAITTAASCPAIELDGRSEPMDERVPPATVPVRPARVDRSEWKPAAFPVRTCDKPLPAGVARAVVAGRALPLPRAEVRRIVVVGDTGCRMLTHDGAFQACNDPAAWQFPAIAERAAALAPDLVVHVGDFHYRESPCPAGDAGCAGSPWGYGWDAWDADVFAPAAPLFAAAPWIVVRGNHESCQRAGQGWWRFLDPRPFDPRQSCDDPADDAVGDRSEPYAVPVRTAGGRTTQFVVFDSSRATTKWLAPADPLYASFRAELERAFALAARSPGSWFLDHHPVLAFAAHPTDPRAMYPGNASLQSVLAALAPGRYFPAAVTVTLAGHIHAFEAVSFATGQPAQLVAGHGGDWLDQPLPDPLPAGAHVAPGAVVDHLVYDNTPGFSVLEPDGARWRLVDRDARGVVRRACTVDGSELRCRPVP